MKQYLHAYAMCQSMFCALPCPWNVWDEKAKDKMLLFLPIVGLEIGALWALLAWLSELLGLPEIVCRAEKYVYHRRDTEENIRPDAVPQN